MRIDQIVIGLARMDTYSSSDRSAGPIRSNTSVYYEFSDETEELLLSILTQYKQHPDIYFESINRGKPPEPWSIICFDREYDIAGHVATTRSDSSQVLFTQYSSFPNPIPIGFVPKVGVIVLLSKEALLSSEQNSPIFEMACVGSSRVDLQACKLEYSIVSPK